MGSGTARVVQSQSVIWAGHCCEQSCVLPFSAQEWNPLTSAGAAHGVAGDAAGEQGSWQGPCAALACASCVCCCVQLVCEPTRGSALGAVSAVYLPPCVSPRGYLRSNVACHALH